jgi:nucleolar GTP-binding protein
MDGKNTMDFFDADIEERLRSLEEEEARLEATGAYAPEEEDEGEGYN